MPGWANRLAGRLCPRPLTVLLTTLLLTPGSLLTPTLPGPPRPRVQVEFDPRRMELRWACREKAEYEHLACEMQHPELGPVTLKPSVLSPWDSPASPPKPGTCGCTFRLCPLRDGVQFTVRGTLRETPVQEGLSYGNPGAEGTAARNFSCLIYGAEFMNCTWLRGRAAPEDVQYFLYLRDTKTRRERPCPSYLQESGRHVGCHLRSVSDLTTYTYFLVNGSSSRTQIRFFDTLLWLKKIEVYDPPRNISVNCSSAHCLVQWRKPRTRRPQGDLEFQYQIRLRRPSEPAGHTQIDISGDEGNQYELPGPRGRLSLQMRSANARLEPGDPWGVWSHPLPFGHEEPVSSLVYVYFPVVLGTLVCGCLLLFVCSRFLGTSTLFSRIPQVRDKLNDGQEVDQQVPWEKCLATDGKTDSEHVLVVTLAGGDADPAVPGRTTRGLTPVGSEDQLSCDAFDFGYYYLFLRKRWFFFFTQ
ncbi:granulocyte-macrophage colony-stimulating factor receptor subunit alpha-like, partial [Sorex fumeus]|uniref:granulocyte-macrophage colony-stimulating factor receptor subunit alpha-like n=1 Tax=Sorex fumeus TaxID=62283 RepID=UPI0024ACFD5E